MFVKSCTDQYQLAMPPTAQPVSLTRQFAIEAHGRAIDACTDIEELRRAAKSLLHAWQLQASFSEDYAAQLLGLKPRSF